MEEQIYTESERDWIVIGIVTNRTQTNKSETVCVCSSSVTSAHLHRTKLHRNCPLPPLRLVIFHPWFECNCYPACLPHKPNTSQDADIYNLNMIWALSEVKWRKGNHRERKKAIRCRHRYKLALAVRVQSWSCEPLAISVVRALCPELTRMTKIDYTLPSCNAMLHCHRFPNLAMKSFIFHRLWSYYERRNLKMHHQAPTHA